MRRAHRFIPLFITILLFVVSLSFVSAQDNSPLSPAEIVNDEGGVVRAIGEMAYTNLLFTQGVAQPIILLEDQAGFIDRNEGFNFPLASQVLGSFTSDFFTSPVEYSINLPIEPGGSLRDVDNDGEDDIGVMVYTPAYWENRFGDPFLQERDTSGGGWSTAFATTIAAPGTNEIIGGHYLVYAPDDEQGFPLDFGDDELLFTADDPTVMLPAGWTIVDMNTTPFTFDRSRIADLDLLEPATMALNDFSNMRYTDAFDAMVALMRDEYAFTEYKNVDWDALYEEFYPRFEAAETNEDTLAYKVAMRDFSWHIPDGHIGVFGAGARDLSNILAEETDGGLGLTLMQLDDGRVIVDFVVTNGPAQEAGIEVGSEVIAINGEVIEDALANTVVYGRPYSTTHNERLEQLRYVTRSRIDTEVEITFKAPNGRTVRTTTLTSIPERISWRRASLNRGSSDFAGPVEYEFLSNSGYGYVKINTFSENSLLTVQDWEYFLGLVNQRGLDGIIIDMRFNGGGDGNLATQLAGYFFNEETAVGQRGFFNEDIGEFEFNEDVTRIIYPAPEQNRFDGEIVVLVSPACASACEFFSYYMGLLDNVSVVGQYPSAGLGGSVDDFVMPEELRVRFTVGRAVDLNGEINIEGIGVVPDVRVPVNEETTLTDFDIVLEAGITQLDNALAVPFVEGTTLEIGETATGEILPNQRVRHTLVGPSDSATVTVVFDDGEAIATVRIYTMQGRELAEFTTNELPNLPLREDVAGTMLIVEIAVADDTYEGSYTIQLTSP